MKRTFLALFLLSAFACKTATVPAAQETPQCNPALPLVNAVLYVQSSAEYRAVAMGTYANARRALDAALADPNWVGADEEQVNDPSQPPAIVLDVDETAVSNIQFEQQVVAQGKTYDSATWKAWTASGAGIAVPGAAEFLNYAKSRGVTPFYVTNRDADEEQGTRANLQRVGFPLDANVDTVLLRGEQDWKTSDKGPRRQWVADRYRILLLLGDDLNDFTNAREKSKAERDSIVAAKESWWGTRWFMIPNPMYGSFERAAIGNEGDDCAKMQRKLIAIKP